MKGLLSGIGIVTVLAATAGAQGTVYTPGNGVTAPRVVQKVRPVYPEAAKKAMRQGSVMLECVVATDGTVDEVTVSRASDEEFRDAAVAAAWQYRFSPGTKHGQPVAVRIPMEIVFTLR